MTPAALKLVAGFEAEAQAAQEAEARLRKSMAEEIARIERERAFAFRRTRLIRLLAASATEAKDEESAVAAQTQALSNELALSAENPAHQEILARLEPVGKAVWQCACSSDDAMNTATAGTMLRDFETWFEHARGQSFYSLFDQYVPETPLVDF